MILAKNKEAQSHYCGLFEKSKVQKTYLALTAGTPGFVGDADMAAWPASLEKVRDRFPDARLVVPGHGAADDLALIDHTIELCRQQ